MSSRYGIRSLRSETSKIKRFQEHSPDSRCPICGEYLDITRDTLSQDHVIPRFYAKWALNISNEQKDALIKLLGTRDNIIIVHEHCNFNKGCELPDISSLHITDAAKQSLHDIIDKARFAILDCKSVLEIVAKRQNYRCYRCHRKINLHDSVLRRKYGGSPRTVDNAVCLCSSCN